MSDYPTRKTIRPHDLTPARLRASRSEQKCADADLHHELAQIATLSGKPANLEIYGVIFRKWCSLSVDEIEKRVRPAGHGDWRREIPQYLVDKRDREAKNRFASRRNFGNLKNWTRQSETMWTLQHLHVGYRVVQGPYGGYAASFRRDGEVAWTRISGWHREIDVAKLAAFDAVNPPHRATVEAIEEVA